MSIARFDTWQTTLGNPVNSVIQIANARSGPARQTIASTSPVLVDGLTINFTPRSASSLIIITASVNGSSTHVNSLSVFRDGAKVVSTTGQTNNNEPDMHITNHYGQTTTDWLFTWPLVHYESAGSTESRNYSIYCTSGWSGVTYTTYINNRASNDMAGFSYMNIMEIAR
jgi:hypothetical protein